MLARCPPGFQFRSRLSAGTLFYSGSSPRGLHKSDLSSYSRGRGALILCCLTTYDNLFSGERDPFNPYLRETVWE